MKSLVLLFSISMAVHAEVPKVDLNEVKLTTLCASLLDRQEQLGEFRSSAVTQAVIGQPMVQLFDQVQTATVRRGQVSILQTLKDYFAYVRQGGYAKALPFKVDDLNKQPLTDAEIRNYRTAAFYLRDLHTNIGTLPSNVVPVRRVTEGRQKIMDEIDALLDDARGEEAKIKQKFLRTRAAFKRDMHAKDASILAEMKAFRAKALAERSVSKRAMWYGPSSKMPNGQRAAWLAGYSTLAGGATLLAGLINPALMPVSVMAFGAGWVGIRQHLYYAVDQMKIAIRGYTEIMPADIEVHDHEYWQKNAVRAETVVANLTEIRAMAERTDAPYALAYYRTPVKFGNKRKLGYGKDAVLTGAGVRAEAAKETAHKGKSRKAELELMLSFNHEKGEPSLVTSMVEVENKWFSSKRFDHFLLMTLGKR